MRQMLPKATDSRSNHSGPCPSRWYRSAAVRKAPGSERSLRRASVRALYRFRAVVSAVGYQDVGLASTGNSSDTAAQRPPAKLAWVELLVDDSHAAEFVQTLAAGDPDVAVLPASTASATVGARQ